MPLVSFLSLRNVLYCQPVFLGVCIALQSRKEVGQAQGVVMQRRVRGEMLGPGAREASRSKKEALEKYPHAPYSSIHRRETYKKESG